MYSAYKKFKRQSNQVAQSWVYILCESVPMTVTYEVGEADGDNFIFAMKIRLLVTIFPINARLSGAD
jgi:hypothetical protein